MLAITKNGLSVPHDISLIDYGSGERAVFVRSALSSVYFPISDMACYATRKLIKLEIAQKYLPHILLTGSAFAQYVNAGYRKVKTLS